MPPPAQSATSGEITCNKPVDQVLQWIIEGQNDADVQEAIKKLWPSEDPEKLYEAAVDRVSDASKVEGEVLLGWCLMARRELFRKMFEIGDFAGALRATEKIESLIPKLGQNVKTPQQEG